MARRQVTEVIVRDRRLSDDGQGIPRLHWVLEE